MTAPKKARSGDTPEEPLLRQAEGVLRTPPGPDVLLAEYAALLNAYRSLSRKFYKTVHISDSYQRQVKEMAIRLEQITAKFRQLRAVAMPICVHCRRVRSDNDEYWEQLETFVSRNADIMFSQGVCPECRKAEYAKLGSPQGVAPKIRTPVAKTARTEDESVHDLRDLARRVSPDDPSLAQDLEKFVERYAKQTRRFTKTLTISDSYQSQLRDLNMRLELMARTDLLTGLANRWEMTNHLESERSRMERYGSQFSIILGDVDYFKAVNDTYGHQGGDCVLRNLARTMRSNLRNEDLCARWGGEEFLILLPETDGPAALRVAEKICGLVRDSRTRWEGKQIDVTMSFGVATAASGATIDACLKQADDALYAAKQAGRDRVAASWDLPAPEPGCPPVCPPGDPA